MKATNKLRLLVQLFISGTTLAPFLIQAQVTETYTFTTNRLVPDGDPSGLSDVRTLNSSITNISSVTVNLSIAGQFNGDLYAYLVHSSGFTVLLNRPGKTAANPYGSADSGLNVTFQTGAANGDIHVYQNVTTPAAGSPLTGTWQPDERNTDPATVLDTSPRNTSLTNFNGLAAGGEWTLFVADMQSGGTNELTAWSITITGQAYSTLTWAAPAGITYGTALGAAQLNASATYDSTNVPGTFTYNPPAGTILSAGSNQTLTVTFTPSNASSFLAVSTNVTINVAQATPILSWANPAGITYGTALSVTQLDANANTDGTFSYTPAAGTVLHAGSAQTLAVLFTPTDTNDYTSASTNVVINVAQATPVISWANPAAITYGTALSGTQLDANASTAGSFTYNPPPGTVLSAGNNQTLSVTFTPTDTTNYTSTSTNATINVAQAATSGSLASSANPSLPNINVTFTVTISPAATGTVNFRVNGLIAGSAALSGGVAAFVTNGLPYGTNTVVAEYAGSQNYLGTTNSLTPAEVIDTPPAAGNITLVRYPTSGTKIGVATILASCTNYVGGTLNLTVSSTSANGGTIADTNGWVIYTEASGYTNDDSFTYTVTDQYGGSAVGTITVDVQISSAPGQNLTIANLGNGPYQINGFGIPGYTYSVQYTATLNPANWQNVDGGSVTADSTGEFQFTVTPSGGEGYYRTVYP